VFFYASDHDFCDAVRII